MEHKTPKITPLSAKLLIKRGECCGSGCKNCPYIPRHQRGSVILDKVESQNLETLESK